ncbi:hypothetical protein [Neobacillus muris]|uniref:hypothetical protein n=1 Tax=Neobacillus muris TaxID=2941334 RepID=UPI00203DB987|nr:hypothetical protein [Neobacillus muris]
MYAHDGELIQYFESNSPEEYLNELRIDTDQQRMYMELLKRNREYVLFDYLLNILIYFTTLVNKYDHINGYFYFCYKIKNDYLLDKFVRLLQGQVPFDEFLKTTLLH